ncbi:MAG: hypothetical protein U9N87_06695, partial [Planctomycetota bacterium]|nr:hypothetical protein [Planctomycetota bacterium]
VSGRSARQTSLSMALRTRRPIMPLTDFQEADADLDAAVYDVLGVKKAVEAMKSYGSTAPAEVDRQIAIWKTRLDG